MPSIALALDKSARFYDVDGRLHVRVSNLSKATVNPYYGREIPNCAALGLDPAKVYKLLRDPAELAKAAETFNNLPIMRQHVATSADEPQKEEIAGSTGTDAAFDGTYLTNSLVIWDAAEIAAIESEEKRELSCGYRYTPIMTPGIFQGLPYDGIMSSLFGNHVALVEQGRAGPDVMVGDSKLEDEPLMPTKLTSRKALMLQGALSGSLAPLLAADAKLDLNPVCQGVTEANFEAMLPTVRRRLDKLTTGKLAADAKLDNVYLAMDAMKDCKAEDDEMDGKDEFPPKKDDDEDDDKKKAKDAAPEPKPDAAKDALPPGVTVAAMDAAIATAATKAARDATAAATANFNAIRQAEADVRPLVGEVQAMDSAAEIYRFALDAKDVDLSDIPADASVSILRAMVKMIPGEAAEQPRIAMDASHRKGLTEKYPGYDRVKQL